MKARAAAVFLVATAGACTTAQPALPSVALVHSERGTSSAVPLSPTWALVAKHALPVRAVDGGPVLEAVPHPELDVALVRVEPRGWTVARLAGEVPEFGDRLLAVGWHLGTFLLATDGRQGKEPELMTCAIMFGASGGAVLNEAGELVGIVEAVTNANAATTMGDRYTIPITHCAHYVPVVGLRSWILSHLNR